MTAPLFAVVNDDQISGDNVVSVHKSLRRALQIQSRLNRSMGANAVATYAVRPMNEAAQAEIDYEERHLHRFGVYSWQK